MILHEARAMFFNVNKKENNLLTMHLKSIHGSVIQYTHNKNLKKIKERKKLSDIY